MRTKIELGKFNQKSVGITQDELRENLYFGYERADVQPTPN